MNFRIENLGILIGLIALAAPILLHLIRRHRYDTLDWGAMQFLPDHVTTQRRRWLDEILLMLMRMAMIALIVIALATPISTSAWLAPIGEGSTRDLVFVLDGSYSMDVRVPGQPTPWDDAIRKASEQLDQAAFGDRFAIVIARQSALFVQEDFTGNVEELRAKLQSLPKPNGNADMAGTLALAWKHLQTRSQAANKRIVIFTDKKIYGWADPASLSALENVGNQWHTDRERARDEGVAVPSMQVIQVGADLPGGLPNYALAPLLASRNVAKPGHTVTFQSALHLQNFTQYERPRGIHVLVDGVRTQTLALPSSSELKQGQLALRFQHRFEKEGPHVVSLAVDADPARDALMADNEQHAIVNVVKEVPILLVDGERALSPESSTFFLERALASSRTKAIPFQSFDASLLDSFRPAVVVLADIPQWSPTQNDAIERYLGNGGGVWVIAGPRMAKQKSNSSPAWLPAKLDAVGQSKDGVQLETRSFQHPALDLFRTGTEGGGIQQARFAQWWNVRPDERATIVAKFNNGQSFLLEKSHLKGKVLLSTVSMDRGWDSTLPSSSEFPILAHQLIYYLAGGQNASAILRGGDPIQLYVGDDSPRLTLQLPGGKPSVVQARGPNWTFADTGAIGVYRVDFAKQRHAFIVQPDPREADLARMSDDDWRRVRDRLPVVWQTDAGTDGDASEGRREELWWLFLLAVLGLLCTEVWMTRRMALARGR